MIDRQVVEAIAAAEGTTLEETTFDGRKLKWSAEARRVLRDVADAYLRRRAKARIEKVARMQKLAVITRELAVPLIEETVGSDRLDSSGAQGGDEAETRVTAMAPASPLPRCSLLSGVPRRVSRSSTGLTQRGSSMRLPRDAWQLSLLLSIAARSSICSSFSFRERGADLPTVAGITEGHSHRAPFGVLGKYMPKRYRDIAGDGGSNVAGQVAEQVARLKARMAGVKRTLAVMSGKGGVGKSTITTNLAMFFAMQGWRVGVIDADINGPSLATMFGVRGHQLRLDTNGVLPAIGPLGVQLMSMDLFLAEDKTPVVWNGPNAETFLWRGTMEMHTLREFLSDVQWGALDILLLDLPPGADRVSTIRDLLPDLHGTVVVTIPSAVSHSRVEVDYPGA